MISYIEQGSNQQRYCINSHAQFSRDNNMLVLCDFLEIQDTRSKIQENFCSYYILTGFPFGSHCYLWKVRILFSPLNCSYRFRLFPVVLKMLLQCILPPGLVLYITNLSSHSLWLSLVHIKYLRMKLL